MWNSKHRSRAVRGIQTCLVACLLVSGCSIALNQKKPNLAAIYNRSAQYHGSDRNPVILIPGVTGSKLVDAKSGRTVWGAFKGDYAKPTRPEDVRLMALPMKKESALNDLRDEVYPDGILDRLRISVLGLPINLRAYFHILSALGAGGYRDETLAQSGAIDYGEGHFTCFQFDYDWRRDNVENAQRLHAFIQEKRTYVLDELRRRDGAAPETVQFDLVAHSMGALLTRYYLRYGAADLPEDGSIPPVTWAGAENVERVVLVGPPNAGTLESIEQLFEGREYGPSLPHYPAAVLGTYPSGYQMLPRQRFGYFVTDPSDRTTVPDMFDPDNWEKNQWGLLAPAEAQTLEWLLPEVPSQRERRAIALDHLRKTLKRARQFTSALDQPASSPETLQLYLIAGDAVPTPAVETIDPGKGRLVVLEHRAGDGAVLRSSALMDERVAGGWSPMLQSPIQWEDVLFLFRGHLGLTKDPVFTDNLLYWLLEDPR
jgi:pimeloyl-ACP methyl ester carboxylesterase